MRQKGFKGWWKRWGALLMFGTFLLAVIIFILTAGSGNKGVDVHCLDGFNEIEVGEQRYTLINDVESETYIGSSIGDVLKARHGDKVGTISSMRILTVSSVYKVKDDSTGNFLVDSRGRIYVKSELAEETKKQLESGEFFTNYQMVSGTNNDKMKTIDPDMVAALTKDAKDMSGKGVVQIDDPVISEDFTIRRIIFAFNEDGSLYHAVQEVFLYKGNIYLTTEFVDNSKENKASILKGKRASEEVEAYFKEEWRIDE